MKKLLPSIIIGVAIIIAAVIVVLNLPRYQYLENEEVEGQGNEQVRTLEQTVFDMVSGKKYTRTSVYSLDGRISSISVNDPNNKPLHKAFLKQREVYGDKRFSRNEWKKWKEEHNW